MEQSADHQKDRRGFFLALACLRSETGEELWVASLPMNQALSLMGDLPEWAKAREGETGFGVFKRSLGQALRRELGEEACAKAAPASWNFWAQNQETRFFKTPAEKRAGGKRAPERAPLEHESAFVLVTVDKNSSAEPSSAIARALAPFSKEGISFSSAQIMPAQFINKRNFQEGSDSLRFWRFARAGAGFLDFLESQHARSALKNALEAVEAVSVGAKRKSAL